MSNHFSSTNARSSNNWNRDNILKREAREPYGIVDFGKVQEVTDEYIITEKGSVVDKARYYFPKHLVDSFDGATVYLKVTEEEAKQYKKNSLIVSAKY